MKLLFTILLLATVGASLAQNIKRIKITDLEKTIAESDHPLIINFWATFCVPCCKEIPYFQTAVARYHDQQVELILVSLDLPDYYPAKIAATARDRGFTSRILWLDETDADYFCPKVDPRWSGGIPCSLFINNKTHYRRFFDRQLTEPQVDLEINEMLAPPAAGGSEIR
ncbi:MAG TPA: TlpA disulfide reductase family protein [Puia sp.]|nr:TlpA disulfide reductase family protein [Puia sp.]